MLTAAAIGAALAITPNPSIGQDLPARQTVSAVATGYCLSGRKTATDKVVYQGCIALSDTCRRKLKAKYGDKIEVVGTGTYTFDDRSPQKFSHVDIHFPKYKDACNFGKKKVLVRVLR